ncbi:MAG: DUF167 domain-containing protein, partial [Candidatus Paceibacterota bacterium]
YIRVKVKTESKKEEFKKIGEDHFEISVKEPAERNLANKRVLEILALNFKLTQNKFQIIKGQKMPNKIILVTN